jgi:PIN domain nuclease of toxin-antitoxin system
MKYLLDTHTFIWFIEGSDELSKKAINLVVDENNEIYLSMASLWEISIKVGLGKLSIKGGYENVMDDIVNNDITLLPIDFAHTLVQSELSFHHRDPFDRILIAQAIAENMSIIGRDEIFDTYFEPKEVKRIW